METRGNFGTTTTLFSSTTPVQTEAAYSPNRSLWFPSARVIVCRNNMNNDYLRGQRAKSDRGSEFS